MMSFLFPSLCAALAAMIPNICDMVPPVKIYLTSMPGAIRSVLGSLVKHYNELCNPEQHQAPVVQWPVEPNCFGAHRLQTPPWIKLVKLGPEPYTGYLF